jgi:hypothetical protein
VVMGIDVMSRFAMRIKPFISTLPAGNLPQNHDFIGCQTQLSDPSPTKTFRIRTMAAKGRAILRTSSEYRASN